MSVQKVEFPEFCPPSSILVEIENVIYLENRKGYCNFKIIFDHLDIRDLWYIASEKCQISQILLTIFNFVGN